MFAFDGPASPIRIAGSVPLMQIAFGSALSWLHKRPEQVLPAAVR